MVVQLAANNVATGAPTISGAVRVDEALTAVTSGISDADGLSGVSFSYQWIRSDGTTDTDIAGMTSSTYTLVTADEGKSIKVRVSFTDNANYTESLTSAATAAVPDGTAPSFTNSACAHNYCQLNFSEILNGNARPPTGAFALTADSATVTLSAVEVVGSVVTLTIASPPVRSGQTVSLTYTDPSSGDDAAAIQDAAGNDAATFTATLTNNSPYFLPGVPTGLSAAEVSRTQIDLSWTAPTDDGGDSQALRYRIEVSTDAGSNWTDRVGEDPGHTGTEYSHTGLSAGETRHYRVSAVNVVGAGTASSVANATTWVANRAPTGTPTITGSTHVGATLTAVTSDISDADGMANGSFSYQWIRSSSTDSDISHATASTYTPVAADVDKTIKVRVSFTDDRGTVESLTSAATTAVAAVTDDTAPTLSSSACDHSSCTLKFNENLDGTTLPPTSAFALTADGGAVTLEGVGITGADVTLNIESPYVRKGQTLSLTYTDPTVDVDDAAAIQDASGNDAATFTATPDNTSPYSLPGAPTGLSAAADGPTRIDLSWTAPADDGHTSAALDLTYIVEVSDDGVSSWSVQVAGHADTKYSHTGLRADSTRHYRVSAVNIVGTSTVPSNAASATTGQATAPGDVLAVLISSGDRQLTVGWLAPEYDGGSPITGYVVQWKRLDDLDYDEMSRQAEVAADRHRYTITGLTNGTVYTVRVRAKNAAGLGDSALEPTGIPTPGHPETETGTGGRLGRFGRSAAGGCGRGDRQSRLWCSGIRGDVHGGRRR